MVWVASSSAHGADDDTTEMADKLALGFYT